MKRACYHCHTKTAEKLVKKFDLPKDQAEEFYYQTNSFLQHYWYLSNPLIATNMQRIARKHFNMDDVYREEKLSANLILLNNYEYWKSRIDASNDPFKTAAKLAVIGNIIDYGAHSVPGSIDEFVHKQMEKALFYDDSEQLQKAINAAKSVLYLGDNAGEIVFDKLFIETMKHPNITFVVRGNNVLNDVTHYDAELVGIDKICRVIDNGYDAPSTLLDKCSPEFIEAFKNADLIISKGQGNFEGLMNHQNRNIFFMLMAKCEIIADMLKAQKGSMIIKQQS